MTDASKDSFYIYLPSNASMKKYPDNKPSDYQVELLQPLQLEGEWEVGVSNICYHSAIQNESAVEEMTISCKTYDTVPLNDIYHISYNLTKDGKWNYDWIQLATDDLDLNDLDLYDLNNLNKIATIFNSANDIIMKNKKQRAYRFTLRRWYKTGFFKFHAFSSGLSIRLDPKLSVHFGFGHGTHITPGFMANTKREKRVLDKTNFRFKIFDETLIELENCIILKDRGVKALKLDELVKRWNETVGLKYGEQAGATLGKFVIEKLNSKLTFNMSPKLKSTTKHFSPIIGRGSFYGIHPYGRYDDSIDDSIDELWWVDVYGDRLKKVPTNIKQQNFTINTTPRQYYTVEDFIQVINLKMEHLLNKSLEEKYDTRLHHISFSIENQKTVLKLGEYIKCYLNKHLMSLFGFSQQSFSEKRSVSVESPMTLDKREQHLFIQSNITPPVLFGDQKEYILRDFIHEKDALYGIIEKNFKPIFFLPVIKQTIPIINLKITNGLRECVHLKDTKSLITLLFRKAK